MTYESGARQLVAGEARDTDQFGHVVLGGVGDALAREIEQRTGFETRVTRARARAARRDPDTARSDPRDAIRPRGLGPRPRGALRPHGRTSRRRGRGRLAGGGDAGSSRRCPQSGTKSRARSSDRCGATIAPPSPEWRNWQTRGTQNPVSFGTCGFDPHLRHSEPLVLRCDWFWFAQHGASTDTLGTPAEPARYRVIRREEE